jgi:hypothetical protein
MERALDAEAVRELDSGIIPDRSTSSITTAYTRFSLDVHARFK